MSYYFDKRDGLWRVQVQKQGARVSTTARTEDEARGLDEKLRRDLGIMHRRKTGVLPDFAPDPAAAALWSKQIEDAFANRGTWFWKSHSRMARRHKKKQSPGPAIRPEELKTLYMESRGRCAISGLRLKLPGLDLRAPLTASVDRIDSRYGYILPNCRIVALCVNLAMSDWGEDLFNKLCYGVVVKEFL